MEALYKFTCSHCEYANEVSGGRDCGMLAVVETRICSQCRALVDVLIGAQGKDGPTGDENLDEQLNLCPQCGGDSTKPWPPSHPCPRCGQSMIQGEMVALWD